MTSTLRQIYNNPHYYGHTFLQPADTVLKKIFQAVEALRKEEIIQDPRRKALAPLAQGPVELNIGQVVGLAIDQNSGQSDLPYLSGLTFEWERTSTLGKMRVSIIKGEVVPEPQKCQKRTNLLALTALGIVTAPLTVPAALLGMAIKVSQYGCSKRSLSVLPIDRKDYFQIAEVAKKWEEVALSKSNKMSPSFNSDNIFSECAKISRLIHQCLTNRSSYGTIFDEAYVCKDNWGVAQGIILLRNDFRQLKIAHLVTHPHNIRSPLNANELEKIQGVGTALIRFAADRCLDLNKEALYLEGTVSSEPFYTQLGFELVTPIRGIEDGDYAMEMKAQKIRELFHSHTKAA